VGALFVRTCYFQYQFVLQRPSRKQFWLWALSVLLLAAIICSLPPVRSQYHQWHLDSAKIRKSRLLAADPSALDRFWLHVTGTPVSGQELDAAIRRHQDALVRLGFLDRHTLPAQMVSACPETLKTLDELRCKCPWFHTETLSGTNVVLTACSEMMADWRKRAQQLGW
jgi:hypothetical protein